MCSLNFAARVRAVELGGAKKTVDSAEVAALKKRIAELEVCPLLPVAAIVSVMLVECMAVDTAFPHRNWPGASVTHSGWSPCGHPTLGIWHLSANFSTMYLSSN